MEYQCNQIDSSDKESEVSRSIRAAIAAFLLAGFASIGGLAIPAQAKVETLPCSQEGHYDAVSESKRVATAKRANSTCGTYSVRGTYVVTTTGFRTELGWKHAKKVTAAQTTTYSFVASKHLTTYSNQLNLTP